MKKTAFFKPSDCQIYRDILAMPFGWKSSRENPVSQFIFCRLVILVTSESYPGSYLGVLFLAFSLTLSNRNTIFRASENRSNARLPAPDQEANLHSLLSRMFLPLRHSPASMSCVLFHVPHEAVVG
jgi:hypothetical protein